MLDRETLEELRRLNVGIVVHELSSRCLYPLSEILGTRQPCTCGAIAEQWATVMGALQEHLPDLLDAAERGIESDDTQELT